MIGYTAFCILLVVGLAAIAYLTRRTDPSNRLIANERRLPPAARMVAKLPQLERISEEPPLPADDEWVLVHIPDTQRAFQENPVGLGYFEAITSWLENNAARYSIRYIAHTGDLIETNSVGQHWTDAVPFVERLRAIAPTGISAGNHDMSDWGDVSNYREWIGPETVFSNQVGEWTFVHGPCDPTAQDLERILQLAAAAPGNICYVTHAFLGPEAPPRSRQDFLFDGKGVMRWSCVFGPDRTPPSQVWARLQQLPNLKLILCGHQSQTRALRIDLLTPGDRVVTVCLADYLGEAIRLMYIGPDRIRVFTYDPRSSARIVGEQHTFTIALETK